MARKARVKSESGMYYAVLRGNGRTLFSGQEDYSRFEALLKNAAERDYAEIYAYKLLSETAYLVLKEGLRPIGETIQSITSNYANYVNRKYNLAGKLFYDRYASEPIETDGDLIDAVRCVFNTKSGGYTNYNSYITKKGIYSDSFMLIMDSSIMSFKEEMQKAPERIYNSGEKKRTVTDEELVAELKRITRDMTAEEIENLTLPVLGKISAALIKAGASIRRLARILQVNKSTIERALKTVESSDSYDI